MPANSTLSQAEEHLLHAETTKFLGTFAISTGQIEPHPHQRPLTYGWVQELKAAFAQGIDRSTYPAKAILRDSIYTNQLQELIVQHVGSPYVPVLPQGIMVLVFDGQHQIAACQELEDAEQHWWIVRVYHSSLEHEYPAEFISLIHVANNPTYLLENSDAQRFKGMYRLRTLLEEKTISLETYKANRTRIGGSKESTRRGLNNLCVDYGLCTAIHEALSNPYIANHFFASGWRSLTTGRFYMIIIWLLAEMVHQVNLLANGSSDCSSAPFSLTSQVTTFSHLEEGLKTKGHSWHQLPGGFAEALHRIKQGPAAYGFSTPLTKANGNQWSFPSRAFLPAVMSSNVVTEQIEILYHITQHLIHMIAGPHALAQYTSHAGARDENDHPVGIINKVLGKRALNADGTVGTGALKILVHGWTNRQQLKKELLDFQLENPAAGSPAGYQMLVDKSHLWWTWLSMFKTSFFAQGLGITVPKQFVPVLDLGNITLEATVQQAGSAVVQNEVLTQGSFVQAEEQTSRSRSPAPQMGDTEDGSTGTGTEAQHARHLEGEVPDKVQPGQSTAATEQPTKKRRRRKTQVDLPERNLEHEKNALSQSTGHPGLDGQIQELTRRSLEMSWPEADSIAALLRALNDLKGPSVEEVHKILLQMVPEAVEKAKYQAQAQDTPNDG